MYPLYIQLFVAQAHVTEDDITDVETRSPNLKCFFQSLTSL